MNTILITFGLVFLAGMAKAVMDASSENRFGNKWMNKGESWPNKYDFNILGIKIPKRISSTILVFLTDGWHFFQEIFLRLIYASIAINLPLEPIDKVLCVVFYFPFVLGIPFEILHSLFKEKSK